jgi:hypothetical protein
MDAWSLAAVGVSIVALAFGLMLAFRGYEWRGRRGRVIEAVALAFWTAAVSVILTRKPLLTGFLSVAAIVVALFLSKRYIRYIYGAIGGAIFFVIGSLLFVGIWAVPVFELTRAWQIIVMAPITAGGVYLGLRYSDVTVILSTALAGAQYTALGALGLYAVVTDASAAFIGKPLLAAIVPVTGLIVPVTNPGAAIIQWAVAVLVLVSGFIHQWGRYRDAPRQTGAGNAV